MGKCISMGDCEMEIHKIVVRQALAFCLACLLGCSEEPSRGATVQVDKTECQPTKLECIQTELSNIAAGVRYGCPPYDYVASLTNKLSALSPSEREEAFRFAEKAFSRPKLKEGSFWERQHSMYAFGEIVLDISNVFLVKWDRPTEVWDFLLRAISELDKDCLVVSAPDFKVHESARVSRIMKGSYVDYMKQEKNRVILLAFERSPLFGKYYHQLPVERQKEWIARLEKAAGRKVDIFDPKNPKRESPRQPFTVPEYLPLQVQELMRNQRREALKKAGIDPSVEGL